MSDSSRRLCWWICSIIFVFTGCLQKESSPIPEEKTPPVEIVESDFQQAEIVALIHLVAIRDVKWYADQWGHVGYIKYHMRGNVKRIFKGLDTSKTIIDYRCTLEADFRDRSSYPEVGKDYLVFLKKEPESGELWLYAEGAHYPSSKRFEILLDSIAANSGLP